MTEQVNEEQIIAFMRVLINMNLSQNVVDGITMFLMDNPDKMDQLIAYIKRNINATEQDLLKETARLLQMK